MVEVVTIGAYGWDAESFFDALTRERIAMFCDVRRRRGVRGAEYAFVNSKRLQARLSEFGIAYEHRIELSPGTAVREAQYAEDRAMGIAKRERTRLGPAFEVAYAAECLAGFDATGFLAELGAKGPLCLFCVERNPAACHRSLLAAHLANEGASVRHLLP